MIPREILKKIRQIEIRTNRIVIGANGTLGMFWGLLLLCSCATPPGQPALVPALELPAELAMNGEAGRGSWLIVVLRSENGEELSFMVDTGASNTILDKSLEPKLGKRSGTVTLGMFRSSEQAGLFVAPRLFWGSTPLKTEDLIATYDFKSLSALAGRPIMGCLGMGCLRHYCIQLDFEAGKVRILDSEHTSTREWGKAFPMSELGPGDPLPCIRENLLGSPSSRSLVDTGDTGDGWLMPGNFQQWTNQAKASANGEARSPSGVLAGEAYPRLSLRQADVKCDGIGLHFLSRHLVTLDFPKQTMYLKRTSIGPLPLATITSPLSFLRSLKDEGQLPGWSKNERGTPKEAKMDPSFNSGTLELLKDGESFVYRYQIARTSKDSPWQLQKAWRTDQDNHSVAIYPIP